MLLWNVLIYPSFYPKDVNIWCAQLHTKQKRFFICTNSFCHLWCRLSHNNKKTQVLEGKMMLITHLIFSICIKWELLSWLEDLLVDLLCSGLTSSLTFLLGGAFEQVKSSSETKWRRRTYRNLFRGGKKLL